MSLGVVSLLLLASTQTPAAPSPSPVPAVAAHAVSPTGPPVPPPPEIDATGTWEGHTSQGLDIEIEVDTLDQLKEALPHAPTAILLDNFSLADLKAAVKLAKGKALLEASGGVTLQNVLAVAETGVDVISIGALTHSARALDVGLDVI